MRVCAGEGVCVRGERGRERGRECVEWDPNLHNQITRRMQCIVGSLYAVYMAAIFGVVQNYAR